MSCSHNFRNINLIPKCDRLQLVDTGNLNDNDVGVTNIVFLYGRRLDPVMYPESKPLIGYWDTSLEKVGLTMSDICLMDFCKFATVGRKGTHANKIVPIQKSKRKTVPVFYPRGQQYADVDNEKHYVYCKMFLIRFESWGGDVDYADLFNFNDLDSEESNVDIQVGYVNRFNDFLANLDTKIF